MAQMRLQDFVIGVILFSLVVIGFVLYVGELGQEYGRTTDPDFEGTFSKINSTLNLAESIEEKTSRKEISGDTPTATAFTAALDAVRATTTSLTLINEIVEAFAEDIGIDPRLANGVLIVLGILLAFLIVAFIRGSIAIT